VLETGGGLMKAAPLLQDADTVVVMNVDILTDLSLDNLMIYHREKQPLVTLATRDRDTSRYFLFDEANNLCGWKNVKSGETITAGNGTSNGEVFNPKAFSGIHILNTKIFSLIQQTGRFSIVDVYLDLMKSHTIKSFDHSETKFLDVGKPDSLVMAEGMFT
jgi:NDP-sugar pyrophosphorylase family protein